MFTLLLDSTLGLDFLNTHIIDLSNFMGEFIGERMSNLTNVARALGAIFAMIAIAMQLYKSMGRGEGIDILALMRPLLFAIVLGCWPAICKTITAPGLMLESHFAKVFESEKDVIYALREKRGEVAWNLADILRERRAAAKQAEMTVAKNQHWTKEALEFMENGLQWLNDQLKSWSVILDTWAEKWVENIIMWFGELFWQCAVYYIFMCKNIFLCVLTMFGPIFISASILPAWENTWTKWVGRMVSVSFYGVMAYIVMIFTLQLMHYTLWADIESLKNMESMLSVFEYKAGLMGSTMLTFVAMVVGYKALMDLVPELATWIIPIDGGMASTQFIRGMTNGFSGVGGARMAGKNFMRK